MSRIESGGTQPPGAGVIQIKGADGRVRTYRRGARTFDDTLGFMVEHGAWEQWSFLNLGGPMHPMHIHLIDFQVLSRDVYPAGPDSPFDIALGVRARRWSTAAGCRCRRATRAGRTSSRCPRGRWST
ncbi:multicopper oxidase domain-containing protein [Streptomyces stramineus]